MLQTPLKVKNKEAPRSLKAIRSAAGTFAHRWKGTSRENANTQVFWAEFFQVFGIDSKRFVTFERHATRFTTQQNGRIDVFWPGELLVEQKSLGKDLTKATDQAFDYLDGLSNAEMPGLVVVSDFENFEVHDLTVVPAKVTKFKLNQLPQRIALFTWMAGYTRRPAVKGEEQVANKKAVKKMGDLYDALSQDNHSDHFTSVLLARILFLLFAEDTGLLDRGLFEQILNDRSRKDGSDLGGLLGQIFQTLDTDPAERSERADELLLRLPYVNGGIFSENIPLANFDESMRDALLAATDFDWGTISPAVFGSMFQSVKSKELRRDRGEHYTTERDIMKVLGPLFLDELKAAFTAAEFSVKKLNALWDKIASLRFLDPACGCGNFLIITYRELREMELQIMERLEDLAGSGQSSLIDEDMGLKVSLAQFHGIEIEEWPARIAEVALFIADHQANRRMIETVGQAPDRLPIKVAAKIVRDNAIRVDWNWVLPVSENVIVLGNPPFGGQGKNSDEQVDDLKIAWGKARYQGYMDFVTAWYAKAIDYFGEVNGRFAFVSTSSICQGEPVAGVFKPIFKSGWRIAFAHRGFLWVSEATGKAGVHVSILGFDKQAAESAALFTYGNGGKGDPEKHLVPSVSPYLTAGPQLVVEGATKPISPALPKVTYGIKPVEGGHLIVTEDDIAAVRADRAAAKYLRRCIGAKQLIHDLPRWCLWMTELDSEDVVASPLLRDRIASVRTTRLASTDKEAREGAARPHEFLRARLHPTTNYLAIPRHVGETRPYFLAGYFTPEVINTDANFMAEDPDGFLFGILSSSLYLAWQKMVGGRIRADLRFANTLTWNTFPLPSTPTDFEREQVVKAAQGVLHAREQQPGRSLAQMYNPLAMRSDLLKAHKELDSAVYKLFGLRKAPETEVDRQEFLFQRYAELVLSR